MTFQDLPANWTELPLSTPNLAVDAVDLLLSEALRLEDTMLILPCDESDIGYPHPIALSETEWFINTQKRREMLEALATIRVPSAVVAISSSRQLPADVVNAWYTDMQTAFSRAGIRMIGFFTAWPNHVNEAAVPDTSGT